MKQPGFFDVDARLARLSSLGNQLEAFSRTMDFEVLRPGLEKVLAESDGSKEEGRWKHVAQRSRHSISLTTNPMSPSTGSFD